MGDGVEGEWGSYNLGIYCLNISFFTQVELEMHFELQHFLAAMIPNVNPDFVYVGYSRLNF
jgi:hypothetical protein